MKRKISSRNQRNPTKTICKNTDELMRYLTLRDMKILELLAKYRILTSAQISDFTAIYKDEITPFCSIKSGLQKCNKRLRILFDIGVIEKKTPLIEMGKGTSVQYCWLSNLGLQLFGINSKARKDLSPDYLHTSGLADIAFKFHSSTQIKARYVEPEKRQKTTSLLIPDIVAAYEKNGIPNFLIIEYDRCTKPLKAEKDKIKKYRDWALSRLWYGEDWCRLVKNPTHMEFPRLIYVIDDNKPYYQAREREIKKFVGTLTGSNCQTALLSQLSSLI